MKSTTASNRRRSSLLCRLAVVGLAGLSAAAVDPALDDPASARPQFAKSFETPAVESLEFSAPSAQRRFIWNLWAQLSSPVGTTPAPAFETWHGEEDTFSVSSDSVAQRGIHGFRRSSAAEDVGAPVISYTLFNDAAYQHIREHQLSRRSTLERLRREGEKDRRFPADRAVPAFPREALVLKTAWWPVAGAGVTPLPVWDAAFNPSLAAGNGYLTWKRVVLVAPAPERGAASKPVEFGGRTFPPARQFALDSFHHVVLDRSLAARLRKDANASKVASVVLGRPLREGDMLVLVGLNLASHVVDDWAWAALWWHDAPEAGVFATDRPSAVHGWRRFFLMNAAFDANRPTTPSGAPHICFNPWLEARFPDGGHGGGTESNCLTCHRRAAFPATAFLSVTRGDPDPATDPAFAAGLVRTSFLWSLAMHAVDDR